MNLYLRNFALVVFYFINFSNRGAAQASPLPSDTLNISLDSAEGMFLHTNFQLIAQRYNIDANQALVIQAKLWPNPNLSYDRGPLIPINDPNSLYPHSNFFSHSENA